MSAGITHIDPKISDIGDFQVRRALPSSRRRMVGPFIFWDEMGPAVFAPGTGLDVGPHPHIGLATVTYLFEGELMHRDTLGVVAAVRPRDINVMAAGRGIVHSERTGEEPRASGQRLHGIQAWIALPEEVAEAEPCFDHQDAADLPLVERPGATVRVIAGSAYGVTSPALTFSPTLYCEAHLEAGASLSLPDEHEDCALYVVSGDVRLGGEPVAERTMAVLGEGVRPVLMADTPAHVMVLGGAPLGRRYITWNFVASTRERLEKARQDWAQSAAGGFQGTYFALPAGEHEHIPFPDDREGPPASTPDCPTT